MNITGYGQYSKQVKSLKKPGAFEDNVNYQNLQHKLIFMYPMLFADKIKVPNIETILRDFISVTFLSDIFVQNTFNTIGIANQIRPLWDENKKAIDPTTAIWREHQQAQGVYSSEANPPNYPVGADYTGAVQQKINQKTAVIQQLLKSDPKMAKTRPFIEMITLGNLIDVPVIVGTSPYPVDSLHLMYVLIAAIGLGKSLNNPSDIDAIFHELENLDEEKYWNLLNRLTSTPGATRDLKEWLQDNAYTSLRRVGSWRNIPTVSRAARNLASKIKREPQELNPQHRILSPLLIKQSDLDQTKLYFKFVLDPNFAKTRFGIDTSDEKTKMEQMAFAKFGEQLSKVQRTTIGKFQDLIGTVGVSLLASVATLVSTDTPTTDFSKQRSENIDVMFDDIDTRLKDIIIAINQGLIQQTSSESTNKLETLKGLCAIQSSEALRMYIDNTTQVSVPLDFNVDSFMNFTEFFNDFVKRSEAISFKIREEIKYMASNKQQPLMLSRLDSVKSIITESINKFFAEYANDLTDNDDSRLRRVVGAKNNVIRDKTLAAYKSGLVQIFYFMFLAKLQESLCRFIITAEVDIETASNEVTTWPNYVLVLPVEVILALHAATMGASWKHMLAGGVYGEPVRIKDATTRDSLSGSPITTGKSTALTKEQISTRGVFNPNDSYIKGIIKFISQKLRVPNLVVVDSKRGDIYYKLMNQTDINKTKITTIETFIQSKLNRQIVTNTNYY